MARNRQEYYRVPQMLGKVNAVGGINVFDLLKKFAPIRGKPPVTPRVKSNPRLRSRRTNATPTVIEVATAAAVRRVVTAGEARDRGIAAPTAAAKASTCC